MKTVLIMIFSRMSMLIFLFLGVNSLKAQEFDAVKNITPAAPEAAQFQKYGDIPVSYYSGTPNIDIPLYTVQSFDVAVPISLSYHASGVKLTEMASWVGNGWSLSAGGMLSRSVRGNPDFINYIDDQVMGSYFNGGAILSTITDSDYNYVDDIAEQKRDVQPDEYYINFLGRSVKFHIKKDKEIIVDPSDKVKITGPTSVNQYWTVIDEAGTRYIFGNNDNSRELSKHRLPPVSGGAIQVDYISSWYLNSIISVTGHTITFDYERAADFTHLPNQRHYDNYTLITGVSFEGNLCPPLPGSDGTGNIVQGSTGTPYQFKPVRLKQINFTKGGENYNVEFVADNGRQDAYDNLEHQYLEYYKLNFLRVRQGTINKLSYLFNFDNLSNGLWLTSLNKLSNANNGFDGGIEETHSFQYYNHTSLPSTKSYDQDYWGLYNGAGNGQNATLLPDVPNFAAGVDRDYNFTYAQYGILTKINYPTGGFSQFEYEPHTITGNIVVGGLRIKQITSSPNSGPGSDPNVVRRFLYEARGAGANIGSGQSTGTQSAPFVNSYTTTIYNYCYVRGHQYYELNDLMAFSSHSLNGGGFMSIGYTTVQELFGVNAENGRNVYEFTHTASPIYESGYPPVGYEQIFSPIYFNSLMNGRLVKQTTEKKVGTSFFKLNEVVNTYETVVNTSDYIPGLAISFAVDATTANNLTQALDKVKAGGDIHDAVTYLYYRIKPDWVRMTQSVEKNYEGGTNPMVKTTDFTKSNYSNRWFHDFVISTTTTYGVSQDVEITSVTYPFNATSTTANNALRDKYIMRPIASTTVVPVNVPNPLYFRGGSKTTYGIHNVLVGTAPLPEQQFQLTIGSSANGGGQEVLLGKYNSYNSDGLPTEIEDAAGHKTGLIWYEDLLLAKCANAATNEFYFEGFEYLSGKATANPHTGKQYHDGAQSLTISFTRPNNRNYKISYWQFINGKWTHKLEDYLGTQKVFLTGTVVDDIRIYPSDAQMITYTHDSFFGVTSISGPNNQPIYYIRDAAGRLKLLKDQDGNIVQANDYKFLATVSQ